MTWLPIDVEGKGSARDAVLGLHPETYDLHKTFLGACDTAVDPSLIELCRARMAQVLRGREELARHTPETLERLQRWHEEPSFSELERAAIAFAEQFILDPALITTDLTKPLEAVMGARGVINFTTVLSAYEASIRLGALLDLEPAR